MQVGTSTLEVFELNRPSLKHDLNELWLAKRVFGSDLCTVFYGVTDPAIRCHRMRSAILGRGLAEVGEGRAKFAAMFERLYGEAL